MRFYFLGANIMTAFIKYLAERGHKVVTPLPQIPDLVGPTLRVIVTKPKAAGSAV
jgi:hypothetical protein